MADAMRCYAHMMCCRSDVLAASLPTHIFLTLNRKEAMTRFWERKPRTTDIQEDMKTGEG